MRNIAQILILRWYRRTFLTYPKKGFTTAYGEETVKKKRDKGIKGENEARLG